MKTMAVIVLMFGCYVTASVMEDKDGLGAVLASEDNGGLALLQRRTTTRKTAQAENSSRLSPAMLEANPKGYNPCAACLGPNDETTCLWSLVHGSTGLCAVNGDLSSGLCRDPELGGMAKVSKCEASTDRDQECREADECDREKGETCYWFGNHGACAKVPETELLFEFDGYADDTWCRGSRIAGTAGSDPVGVLAHQEACAESCMVDKNCEYFLYRNDISNAKHPYACVTFRSCDEPKSNIWSEASVLFRKRSVQHCTPARSGNQYFENACCEDLKGSGMVEQPGIFWHIFGSPLKTFTECDQLVSYLYLPKSETECWYMCPLLVSDECPTVCAAEK